jgi:DNA-binding MarR family transcriptional regulator
MAITPADLDLGTLALFVGYAHSSAVLAEIHARGHTALRVAHGFVFQHLVEQDRTIGELAARLEVTQQAASKSVAELEELGYVERIADPDDARIRRVRLTEGGHAAIEAARAARARIGRRIAAGAGEARVAAAQKTLVTVLELLGGGTDVRTRRIRAPR